jgi:AraC-like DNA-binding protein
VTEVAALTGFSSVEYFSKVYRRAFAVLPSIDRRQATDAPVFRRHGSSGYTGATNYPSPNDIGPTTRRRTPS